MLTFIKDIFILKLSIPIFLIFWVSLLFKILSKTNLYPTQSMESLDSGQKDSDVNDPEKDEFEYFKRNRPDIFVLISGFSQKTNVTQVLNFMGKDFSMSPVDDGAYGVLFLTTAEGLSTGKAVVRLKSNEHLNEILKKHGGKLNKKPVAIRPLTKSEGIGLVYNLKK